MSKQILTLIKLGNYRETACAAAGIDSRTLRVWMRRGAEGEEPYATFSQKMDEAESGAEAAHVTRLTVASREDWRAAAWILSRKFSDRWGDKVQIEIQERLTEILDCISDVLGSEEAARVFAEITRRSRGEENQDSQKH